MTSFVDNPNAAAIAAVGLTKQFPKTQTPSVKRLSFEIAKGETVAFLGPNGAGKSTTIKMLCGILTPTSGTAAILGFPSGSFDANKRLGLVFGTRSQLFLHMTVEHCLDISAEIYFLTGIEKRKRVAELSEVFAISSFLKRRVRSLSLGERMRCEVVAALLHRPQVLLADEPTIGLDIVAKNSLREIIRNWQKHERTTLMLTSHDLSDVEALCESCILIDHGEKRFDGALNDLRGGFKNLRRIRVTTHESGLQHLEDPLVFQSSHKESDFIHAYEIFTDKTPMSEALSLIAKHYGDRISDFSIGEPTLEEVLGERYARH